MDCEQTAESLPWLMNGTLDTEEQRRVRDHLRGCAGCREELRRTRLVWSLHEGHLPVETVVDYALGGIQDPDRHELVERHLESCPRCSAELDLVRRNPQQPVAGVEGSRLVPGRWTTSPGRTAAWRYFALAATLAALLVGGGWLRSARQQQELAARIAVLTAPRLNVAMIELLPSMVGTVVRGDATVESAVTNEQEIPAKAPELLLILLSGEDACSSACAVEILTDRDQPVWSADGLIPNADGHFAFTLPTSLLPLGRFTVQVFDPSTPDRVTQYVVNASSKSSG